MGLHSSVKRDTPGLWVKTAGNRTGSIVLAIHLLSMGVTFSRASVYVCPYRVCFVLTEIKRSYEACTLMMTFLFRLLNMF